MECALSHLFLLLRSKASGWTLGLVVKPLAETLHLPALLLVLASTECRPWQETGDAPSTSVSATHRETQTEILRPWFGPAQSWPSWAISQEMRDLSLSLPSFPIKNQRLPKGYSKNILLLLRGGERPFCPRSKGFAGQPCVLFQH